MGNEWRRVPVGVGWLEVMEQGDGFPVLIVQTALTANEFVPMGQHLARLGPFRVVLNHRRGYAGSGAPKSPGSIRSDAEDCANLLDTLGIPQAHVVGGSYSSAIALELANGWPDLVASLCLIEAPPVNTASGPEFIAVCEQLIRHKEESGADDALDSFMRSLVGSNWRDVIADQLPNGDKQLEQDAPTFFSHDLPALMQWRFSADVASCIRAPLLYVGGSASGKWFDEVRDQILSWFPNGTFVELAGADHSLAMTHAEDVAAALADFFIATSV